MSSIDRESHVIKAVPKELFIDGQWRSAQDDRTFPVADPATGETLCHVADASPRDAAVALDAAAKAQAAWAAHPPRRRSDILARAYEAMLERQDELALLMTLEMGKPLAESRGEIRYAADFLRWFSEEAVRVGGEYRLSPDGKTRFVTMRQPVGPTLVITPWNFPMAMGTRKLAPAIAAGCTTIVKPAPDTPLTMLALAAVLGEAGLPAGALNVLPTSRAADISGPLLRDGRIRKLSFTGSTAVGRHLIAQAGEQVLRVSMELGGNAPFIVFPDADLDAAVDGALLAKMRNIGEACTAANRFLIHADVLADFTDRLAVRMAGLSLGRGTEPGVTVGPLINPRAVTKVAELVDDAVRRGARVVTGNGPLEGPGNFFTPTVLTEVPLNARLVHEEIFGPIASVIPFSSDNDVVGIANDTEYGLVAYIYTRDLARAFDLSDRLEYGMVGVNTGLVSNAAAPFGGIKHSGIGREGGFEGIQEYLETKYVGIAT
ncbi:NAD-dependent succinate-semialdehyde dehydrogenase [Actinopolymorpha pittospori]|nr:NAD-dependent succinate-semialdehyde dehydrogenase [Actinopolymorpha pittospori]